MKVGTRVTRRTLVVTPNRNTAAASPPDAFAYDEHLLPADVRNNEPSAGGGTRSRPRDADLQADGEKAPLGQVRKSIKRAHVEDMAGNPQGGLATGVKVVPRDASGCPAVDEQEERKPSTQAERGVQGRRKMTLTTASLEAEKGQGSDESAQAIPMTVHDAVQNQNTLATSETPKNELLAKGSVKGTRKQFVEGEDAVAAVRMDGEVEKKHIEPTSTRSAKHCQKSKPDPTLVKNVEPVKTKKDSDSITRKEYKPELQKGETGLQKNSICQKKADANSAPTEGRAVVVVAPRGKKANTKLSKKRPRVTFAGLYRTPQTTKPGDLDDRSQTFVSPSALARLARPPPTLVLTSTMLDAQDGHEQAVVDDLQYVLDSANANRWSPSSRGSLITLAGIVSHPKKRVVMLGHNLAQPTCDSVWMILTKFANIPEAYRIAWFVVGILASDSSFHSVLNAKGIVESDDLHIFVEQTDQPHDKAMSKVLEDRAGLSDLAEILGCSRAMQTQLFRLHSILMLVSSQEGSRTLLDRNQKAVIRFTTALRSSMDKLSTCPKSKSLLLKARKLLGIVEYIGMTPNSCTFVLPMISSMLSVLGCVDGECSEEDKHGTAALGTNVVKWVNTEPTLIGGCLRVLINVSQSDVALRTFVRHKGVRVLLGFLYQSVMSQDRGQQKGTTDDFDNRVLSIALLARNIDQSKLVAIEFLETQVQDASALEFIINLLGSQAAVLNTCNSAKASVGVGGITSSGDEMEQTERGVTVGYLSLLVGALWRQSEVARPTIRACLPEQSGPDVIAEVLDEFLEFQRDAGCVSESVEKHYRRIIEALMG